MDEDLQSSDDRTEEATQERRDEFRERGQVAHSRDLISVLILGASALFLQYYFPAFIRGISTLMADSFVSIQSPATFPSDVLGRLTHIFSQALLLCAPILLLTALIAIFGTFFQTRFNFAWTKLKPDMSRFNILTGLSRMVNGQAAIEIVKGIFKMTIVGAVGYAILRSEMTKTPDLIFFSFEKIWQYWGSITSSLFWGVSLLLISVAAMDYFYSFMTIEAKLRMTKKEVKEDVKRREVDPQLKGKMRQRAREMSFARVSQVTKTATVLITNPTHYSIAVKYEIGMRAPVVLAKGVDHMALHMRELAKSSGIPIVENVPLARSLYGLVKAGHEIPETLYKAVSEVIRYVFKLKGIKVPGKQAA